MFDDVTCDYELPDRPEWAVTFQTKDLDCFMDHYHITADGTLLQRSGWDGQRYVTEEPVDWTGGMNFYQCRTEAGRFTYDWVEYVALFKHGVLMHIELVKLELAQAADAVDPPASSQMEPTTRVADSDPDLPSPPTERS
jgi:hypothetical protein